MIDHLEAMDVEIRIAAVESVWRHLQVAMQRDTSDIVHLHEERMMRSLVDQLITLRAHQIDMRLSASARLSA
jgi:hypothetical protein